MQGTPPNAWYFATLTLLLSCAPELPFQYETEHLEIYSDLGVPFCAADLASFEAVISRAEEELGIEMSGVTEVYVWSYDDWALDTHGCPADTHGCWKSASNTIYTTEFALRHEIIHAIVSRPTLTPFFSEAIADVYSGTEIRFGNTRPSDNEGTSNKTDDLRTAQHFVAWLRDRWGGETIGELATMSGSAFDNFEKVYGMTIEEAEAIYFDEAPYGYPSIYACGGTPMPRASLEEPYWREEISLDCPGGDDTHSSGAGMIAHRTFDISESGYYTVHQNGRWFDIYRCSPALIEDPVAPGAHRYDDVPPHHAGFPDGDYRHYEGQPSWNLYMEAGKHDIGVGLLGHETGTVTLEIAPTLGPHPLD